MIESIADAIKELATQCSYKYDPVNDKLTINSITPNSVKEADIRTKAKELEDEYDSQEYSRKRSIAYPPIGDQLDDLYKKGAFSDEMATKLKKVKDDFPKG